MLYTWNSHNIVYQLDSVTEVKEKWENNRNKRKKKNAVYILSAYMPAIFSINLLIGPPKYDLEYN